MLYKCFYFYGNMTPAEDRDFLEVFAGQGELSAAFRRATRLQDLFFKRNMFFYLLKYP